MHLQRSNAAVSDGALEPDNSLPRVEFANPRGARRAIPERLASRRSSILAVAAYLGIAFYFYWPEDLFESQRTVAGLDSIGQVWDLAWIPFSLSHHLNPFFTTAANYPFGVNLADNAVGPLIGLVLWPVTAIAGPITATNLAFPLAFASAAASMYFVVSHFVCSRWAAFLAGIAYGFSPYMAGEGRLDHLTLVFTGLLPIVFYLLVDIVGFQRIPVRTAGIALGAVLALQIYLAPELLADAALIALVTIVSVIVTNFRLAKRCYRSVLRASLWVVGIFLVVAGYPIWYALAGANHITGPAQPIPTLDFHTDLFDLVVPSSLMRFSPAFAHLGLPSPSDGEVYVGIPLLLAVVTTVLLLRRSAIVRVIAIVGFTAYVFSLGPQLGGYERTFTLPFKVLNYLPLTESEVPGRYSLFVQLSVAILFAFGLDRGLTSWRAFRGTRQSRHKVSRISLRLQIRLGSAALMCAAAALLIPLVPNAPFPSSPVGVPTFFTTAAVSRIPPGSVLLAYPYPQPYSNYEAMLWQSVARFRFQLLGSFALIPGGSAGTPWPPALDPPTVQELFDEGTYGIASPPAPHPTGTPILGNATTFAAIREFLVKYHVQTIAVYPVGDNPKLVIQYLSIILGRPTITGGMCIWFSVPKKLLHY